MHPILPMTDDPVATMVDTVEHGELGFQSYFVRYRWRPTIKSLRFSGIERARMTVSVRGALAAADAILIGPSNPWLSLDPILAVPGLRQAIMARNVPRVAVTPIIGGKAIKGPAAKLMAELNYEVSARAVAQYYGNLINGFIYDQRDRPVQLDDLRTRAMNTLMRTETDKVALAQQVLSWIEEGWGY